MKGREDDGMAKPGDDRWTSTTMCHAMSAHSPRQQKNRQIKKKNLEPKTCFSHNMSISIHN
jgi:hypothetical protein